jgi:hypothetical protein
MISEPGQTTNANCINRFATTSDDSLAAGASIVYATWSNRSKMPIRLASGGNL